MSEPLDVAALRARLAGRVAHEVVPAEGAGSAAVAAIVRDGAVGGEGAEILLIRRAHREGDPWSGHIGFPGGRVAATDADLLATAIRETREEIGVALDRERELIAPLDQLAAIARGRPTGMRIAPFLFASDREPTIAAAHEVAELLWMPLAPMIRGETATTLPYPWQGTTLQMPGFQVGEHVVWGLTYQMLRSLFAAMA